MRPDRPIEHGKTGRNQSLMPRTSQRRRPIRDCTERENDGETKRSCTEQDERTGMEWGRQKKQEKQVHEKTKWSSNIYFFNAKKRGDGVDIQSCCAM
ncbi:hypothetical protein VTN00DRAFT_3567 [Thermoascus crustaceus]|uniref:uncharacterized protein n=1 Tax=Thermoascus crustaceus TaxID=5088 RepID=UPI0037432858